LCHKIWKLCEKNRFSRRMTSFRIQCFPTIDWKLYFNGLYKTKRLKNCNSVNVKSFLSPKTSGIYGVKTACFPDPWLWPVCLPVLYIISIYYIPYISPPAGANTHELIVVFNSEIRKTRTHKGWTKCGNRSGISCHQNSRGLHFMDWKV